MNRDELVALGEAVSIEAIVAHQVTMDRKLDAHMRSERFFRWAVGALLSGMTIAVPVTGGIVGKAIDSRAKVHRHQAKEAAAQEIDRIRPELNELRREDREIRKEHRDDVKELEQKIAASPMRRAPDVVAGSAPMR